MFTLPKSVVVKSEGVETGTPIIVSLMKFKGMDNQFMKFSLEVPESLPLEVKKKGTEKIIGKKYMTINRRIQDDTDNHRVRLEVINWNDKSKSKEYKGVNAVVKSDAVYIPLILDENGNMVYKTPKIVTDKNKNNASYSYDGFTKEGLHVKFYMTKSVGEVTTPAEESDESDGTESSETEEE